MINGKYEYLLGANRYAHESVLRLTLEWPAPASRYMPTPSSDTLRLLRQLLPTLADAAPAAVRSAAQDPLYPWSDQGLDLGRVALHAIVSLHLELGLDCRVCAPCDGADAQRALLVFTCDTLSISVQALRVVVKFLNQIVSADGAATLDPHALRRDFATFAASRLLKADLLYLIQQAHQRDIPALHIGDFRVIFGHGRRQRHMRRQVGHQTSHLGYITAVNKHQSYEFMQRVGLPVPRQFAVYDQAAAVRAAATIGYPVVIKPAATDFGTGITVGAIDAPAVAKAYERARRYGKCVVVEQFIAGDDHRLLVIDGAVVAAARRVPGHVVGDGEHTVAALIERENRNPQRGDTNAKATPLTRLVLDEEAHEVLMLAGRTAQSVPADGEHVPLRRMSNLSRAAPAWMSPIRSIPTTVPLPYWRHR